VPACDGGLITSARVLWGRRVNCMAIPRRSRDCRARPASVQRRNVRSRG